MAKRKLCPLKVVAAGLAWGLVISAIGQGAVRGAEGPASEEAEKVPARVAPTAIIAPAEPSYAEALAARELRRYFYVRSGKLLPIGWGKAPPGPAIVVGSKVRPAVQTAAAGTPWQLTFASLHAEEYLLAVRPPARPGEHPVLVVAGGDPVGTLYGAYRLAERLGVRFYLEGDVVPDTPAEPVIALSAPEVGKPLFDRRGIQPFHDFPEGPDWWNAEAYKAILGQLPKLRMNFFGLHTYPEGGVGPEPLVWIGRAEDLGEGPRVKASYPARHFTTLSGTWGYQAMKTSEYWFGAAALFDRDDYGADYMRGMTPWPRTPADQNVLFQRMGALLADAFGFARKLGIKTCLGTETPLVIPTPVKERLKAQGKDPADPKVVQAVYAAMFRRIMQTHPLDYYWFWTPEGWTWSAVSQKQIDETLADFRAAIAAAHEVKPPFTLATCGWVLGPPQQPALFDQFLPKEMPMSCINRQVGHDPVEPGFAQVRGRPKWAIPWLEDDPALTAPQLWVGRMRKDAADALQYGCTGLLGIHWRTRVLGPNVSALAAAAWDQSAWNPAINKNVVLPKPPEGPLGGQIAAFPKVDIADTEDDPLYLDVRYNTGGYVLDVPNGRYTVTLQLAEPHYAEKGKRVFGAKVQGKTVFEHLDLFAKVGKNRALNFVVKDVEVTDGRLTIELTYEVEFPCIAALAVEGPVTRKINCGGPAYRDYQADWPPSTQGGRTQNRYLPSDDFYADWCRAQFGPEVAQATAAIFARIDCRLPRPADWVHGPGGIKPDSRPWSEVAKEYAFVEELLALRPRVRGAGNIERFDYWASTFQYMQAMAKANCTWALFNAALAKAKAQKDPADRKKLAHELALPLRRQLVAEVAEAHRHLLATVSTTGEMGTVTNWQQHNLPEILGKPGLELAKLLDQPLPPEAQPTRQYVGPPRLLVPVVRTGLSAGERLALSAMVLGAQVRELAVHWRPLGTGEFRTGPSQHVARGVYTVSLPPEATQDDLEYYVEAQTDRGVLRFPATAPRLSQTVVVVEGR